MKYDQKTDFDGERLMGAWVCVVERVDDNPERHAALKDAGWEIIYSWHEGYVAQLKVIATPDVWFPDSLCSFETIMVR